MKIEIWSDVACPWCYIGKRHLEAALEDFPEEAEITWRSFELDTSAPAEIEGNLDELLARKYRMSLQQARAARKRVEDAGAAAGIEFDFDQARSGNTFDAHRLIHFAAARGEGPQMKERLLRAYFTEGQLMSDHDALATLAADIGLDEAEAREALESGAFAEDVREDEAAARANGVRGVPFFVFEGQFGVSGAQPPETLLKVMEQVREKIPLTPEAGAACDADGCEVPAPRQSA